MGRRLLILKSMIKGKPCEMITKSDAEFVTVRDGHKVTNLTSVLATISKELNALNSFKRSFGFTKKDYEAMDTLRNMVDYMEDKKNSSDIMEQLKTLDEHISRLENVQETFNNDLTNLAKALTILQDELNEKEKDHEEDNSDNKVSDDVPGTEDPNETRTFEESTETPSGESEGEGESSSDVNDTIVPDDSPLTDNPDINGEEE